MNNFKNMNIKTPPRGFIGDKLKITTVLNKEIIIHDFKLENSKIYTTRGTCKCLCLQISLNGEKHVVFTSSSGLINTIIQIEKNQFPFTTTIIKDDERFIFS